ncbi:hypothetical protein RB195_009562 [Necator americanus]|uniref:Uncharacterized protein n=1 Tax=Necator americanus TaxID=51031 RepID=A0ABR1CTV7_NECAM
MRQIRRTGRKRVGRAETDENTRHSAEHKGVVRGDECEERRKPTRGDGEERQEVEIDENQTVLGGDLDEQRPETGTRDTPLAVGAWPIRTLYKTGLRGAHMMFIFSAARRGHGEEDKLNRVPSSITNHEAFNVEQLVF